MNLHIKTKFTKKLFSFALIAQIFLGFLVLQPNILPQVLAADPWFDDAWLYRVPITITNPNASAFTDFQVEVDLDNANFTFAEAMPNGADIRFTDIFGTPQPHWLEKYDQVSTTGKIWVKVDSIPANDSKTIYMYYGNPLVPQGSNGYQTFEFFDDFEDRDISDWTQNFVNLGVNSYYDFYSGKLGLVVRSIDYGNIRKAFPGSLVGKTIESNMQYGSPNSGVPNSTSSDIGESFHPMMSVYDTPTSNVGVGAVQYSAGTLPVNNLRQYLDGAITNFANNPVFSYGLGVELINRITFISATQVQTALREADDTVWLGTVTSNYNVSGITNPSIVLGKQPDSVTSLGGGLAYTSWDWVRVREYAPIEPTTAVGAVESQRILAQLQLDTSLPGALQTQYNFTVTPNQPIPNGGSIEITFPSSFIGRLDSLTPSSIQISPHAQITGSAININPLTRTIRLGFASSAPITDPILIAVGDGMGVEGDIQHPSTSGPHSISFTSYDSTPAILATGQLTMSTSGWWNSAWTYRQSVHINNAKVSSDLPVYQVQLRLDASNFDFTHSMSSGEDIRFVTPTGSVLNHWIESYDAIGETALIWISLANISANTEEMVFLYTGNNAASATSNGSNVFDFFDDFEDNDIADWTSYSASPGAITTTSGEVRINELQNTRAFINHTYNGNLDGKALEGVIRYNGTAIGEEYNPTIGYLSTGSASTHIAMGARNYNAGQVPTDRISTWLSTSRIDKLGTNYTTGEDIVYFLNTKANYYLVQTRRHINTNWEAQDTGVYDLSDISSRLIHLGKRAFSQPSLDLNTGPMAEHVWKSVRIRDFVYFEPSTLLGGSEETNLLPETPTNLFINTVAEGADTNAVTPMNFTSRDLVISAEFQEATTSEQGTHYDWEVATDTGFTSIIASATFQELDTPLNDGQRSENIALPSNLPYGTDLYTRLRFYDATGRVSPVTSTTAFRINDAGLPTLANISPAQGSSEIPLNPTITYEVRDSGTGVDLSTISMETNGANAIVNGVCQTGYTCNIVAAGTGFDISVTPDAAFGFSQLVTVDYHISDFTGNVLNSQSTFTTIAAPVNNQTAPGSTGSGGGGYSSGYENLGAPNRPAASNENTNNGMESPASTGAERFVPTKDGVTAAKASLPPRDGNPIGNSCEEMLSRFNYTLPNYLPGSIRTDIALLEKFGVNFSQTLPRELNPDEDVSRSEILKYLLQLTCADYDKDLSGVLRFPDVPTEHQDDFYIHLGRKYSLVNGYMPSGLYFPDKTVSMGEALKITIRDLLSAGKPVNGAMELSNIDYGQWYAPYVRYAAENGLIQEGFNPNKMADLKDVIELLSRAVRVR